MSEKLDTLNAGQQIKVTVTKVPARTDAEQTIARLMRRDPDIARKLRNAHRRRQQNMRSKIRGGRVWYVRPKATKAAIVDEGRSWTMAYTHDLASDFRSVEQFLSIEKA